jgi:hypothetical protein
MLAMIYPFLSYWEILMYHNVMYYAVKTVMCFTFKFNVLLRFSSGSIMKLHFKVKTQYYWLKRID